MLFTAVNGISPLIGEKRKNLEKLQFQQDNLTFRNLHLMMIDFQTSAHTDKLAIYLVVKQMTKVIKIFLMKMFEHHVGI